MEETWQAVFRNLYTGFLLRDFAGKIVPGICLLFSIASMFRSPAEIVGEIKKEFPLFAIVLVGGFAWTVTLGTQSLAEGLGVWSYFPAGGGGSHSEPSNPVGFWVNLFQGGDDTSFDENTAKVDNFQVGATEDQKQQYERFVVIKEGCGNLFVASLFSLPAWLIVLLKRTPSDNGDSVKRSSLQRVRGNVIDWLRKAGAMQVGLLYFVLVMIGLHRMNAQHVHRQIRYTEIVVANRKDRPQAPAVGAPQPSPPKAP